MSKIIGQPITLGGGSFKEIEGLSNSLYFLSEDGKEFTLKVYDETKHWDGALEWNNGGGWKEWDGTTTLESKGLILALRGTGNTVITGSSSNYRWVLTGTEIACIGNIETLLDYATVANGNHPIMADYCYAYMFSYCAFLTSTPELPAITLAEDCYEEMFRGCTSLAIAPELLATTLAKWCYYDMF